MQVDSSIPVFVGDVGLSEEVGEEGKLRRKRNSYHNSTFMSN